MLIKNLILSLVFLSLQSYASQENCAQNFYSAEYPIFLQKLVSLVGKQEQLSMQKSNEAAYESLNSIAQSLLQNSFVKQNWRHYSSPARFDLMRSLVSKIHPDIKVLYSKRDKMNIADFNLAIQKIIYSKSSGYGEGLVNDIIFHQESKQKSSIVDPNQIRTHLNSLSDEQVERYNLQGLLEHLNIRSSAQSDTATSANLNTVGNSSNNNQLSQNTTNSNLANTTGQSNGLPLYNLLSIKTQSTTYTLNFKIDPNLSTQNVAQSSQAPANYSTFVYLNIYDQYGTNIEPIQSNNLYGKSSLASDWDVSLSVLSPSLQDLELNFAKYIVNTQGNFMYKDPILVQYYQQALQDTYSLFYTKTLGNIHKFKFDVNPKIISSKTQTVYPQSLSIITAVNMTSDLILKLITQRAITIKDQSELLDVLLAIKNIEKNAKHSPEYFAALSVDIAYAIMHTEFIEKLIYNSSNASETLDITKLTSIVFSFLSPHSEFNMNANQNGKIVGNGVNKQSFINSLEFLIQTNVYMFGHLDIVYKRFLMANSQFFP